MLVVVLLVLLVLVLVLLVLVLLLVVASGRGGLCGGDGARAVGRGRGAREDARAWWSRVEGQGLCGADAGSTLTCTTRSAGPLSASALHVACLVIVRQR